ncbi:hypothetical protein, partial [Bifidobacterium crudilactis]|uniref:hypothetical protein n=1 Tax=Bifidobacterium crudilactis TaxID=327277 RepID=UPI0026495BE6
HTAKNKYHSTPHPGKENPPPPRDCGEAGPETLRDELLMNKRNPFKSVFTQYYVKNEYRVVFPRF